MVDCVVLFRLLGALLCADVLLFYVRE